MSMFSQLGPPPKKMVEESAEPTVRIRQWQPQWKKDAEGKPREWLVFDSEKNEMHCADCRRFRPSADSESLQDVAWDSEPSSGDDSNLI